MKLQAPKGTRDFYPEEMAWRRHLHEAWRSVSLRHGFEEVDGPIFERLDLYRIKSGEGIVSELFHFEDRGGRELAIRPEFTPTLARMVAAKAASLPRPVKWFCVPNLCRAERPQRGRLREFDQWNIDMLGLDDPLADAEVIAVAVDLLGELGLTEEQVLVRISHREVVRRILGSLGVGDEQMGDALALLDGRAKMPPEGFAEKAGGLGLDEAGIAKLDAICRQPFPVGEVDALRRAAEIEDPLEDLTALDDMLATFGLGDWCVYDLGIVRGLAYYTGVVFELHVTSGQERALGGGGRYDGLVEMLGGPPMSAVGFGMGDVVLTNLLEDEGLIPPDLGPRPDAFVFAITDEAASHVPRILAELRRAGLHARMSYKATRKVGKLLKDAQGCRARFAVLLDEGIAEGRASVKALDTGVQEDVEVGSLAGHLR